MSRTVAVLPEFPGRMSLDELRAAYQAEADRCSQALRQPALAHGADVILRRQRVAALRLREAITAHVQGTLL